MTMMRGPAATFLQTMPTSTPLDVLVVDDARPDCLLLGAWLDAAGARWEAVHDVRDALGALARRTFDVVVLDVDLGEGPSGFDLLERLSDRVEKRELDVVLVSTLGRAPDTLVRGFSLGVEQCLEKPVERVRFLAAMGELRGRAEQRNAHRRPSPRRRSETLTQPNIPKAFGELAITGAVTSRDTPSTGERHAGEPLEVAFDVLTGPKESEALHVVLIDVGADVARLEPAREAIRKALRADLAEADVPAAVDRAVGGEVAMAIVRQGRPSGALSIVTRGLPPFLVVTPGRAPLVVPPSGRDARRDLVLAPGSVLVGFTSGMIGSAVDMVTLMDRVGVSRFGASLALATRAQLTAVLEQARPEFGRRDAGLVLVGRRARS